MANSVGTKATGAAAAFLIAAGAHGDIVWTSQADFAGNSASLNEISHILSATDGNVSLLIDENVPDSNTITDLQGTYLDNIMSLSFSGDSITLDASGGDTSVDNVFPVFSQERTDFSSNDNASFNLAGLEGTDWYVSGWGISTLGENGTNPLQNDTIMEGAVHSFNDQRWFSSTFAITFENAVTGQQGNAFYSLDLSNTQAIVVPAPGAAALLGMAGLAGASRRRRGDSSVTNTIAQMPAADNYTIYSSKGADLGELEVVQSPDAPSLAA